MNQNLQPALTRPHLFPEVRRAVTTVLTDRVAGCITVALIEGQKLRGGTD